MRLIDADALAKFIDYGHLNDPNENLYSENDIREMIDMMPTIHPVKHGHWEVVDGTEPRRYGCSVCKRLSWTEDNYCSYCGCKMDEVEDETN